jgi:hypothetical protein
MFTSNSLPLCGMIYLLSVVDSLVALTMWNQVLQRRDEFLSARVIVRVLLVSFRHTNCKPEDINNL